VNDAGHRYVVAMHINASGHMMQFGQCHSQALDVTHASFYAKLRMLSCTFMPPKVAEHRYAAALHISASGHIMQFGQ
jgi:hypothetical protein